jgi:hypothetical protein
VVVVSESMKEDFESMIVEKYRGKLEIELVVQSLENIPDGHAPLPDRTKPWWTAHAVWCAREAVSDSPVIVMNADDFYGRESLRQAFDFLIDEVSSLQFPVSSDDADSSELKTKNWKLKTGNHCIIPCSLKNMLSDYGTVSRGICEVTDNKLTKIVEHLKVGKKENGEIVSLMPDESEVVLNPETPVNMGLFGFSQDFFITLNVECEKFFQENSQEMKREFFLPNVVMKIIADWLGTVTAIMSTSEWFGMTNKEDRNAAKVAIEKLVAEWVY